MGQEVCRTVVAAEGLELVAAVDPRGPGVAVPTGAGRGEVVVAEKIQALADAGAEVAVDFTVADAAVENMTWCAEHGVHAVVGTTGIPPAEMDEIRSRFEASDANAVIAPNFAIGAVLMMRFCELAAPYMEGVEVIELHHDGKRDAPSGTAVQTTQRIEVARRASGAGGWPDEPTTTVSLEGARGAAGAGGVRVHAVRLPGLVAHQEVIFGALGQTLTIRHDAVDRTSFMPGVELAIRRVPTLPGVTVGLDPLLGL